MVSVQTIFFFFADNPVVLSGSRCPGGSSATKGFRPYYQAK
jgi:hypothetical protein